MIDHRGGSTLHGADSAVHEWIKAPPGAGPAPVCQHCGCRQTENSLTQPCRRDRYEAAPVNNIDYDPYINP